MNKNVIFFLFILGFLSINTSAQLVEDLYKIYDPIYYSTSSYDSSAIISPFGVIKPGVNYSLSMGTGYSSFGKGTGISGSYIAPSVSYSPNAKLQVIAGVSLSRTNMHGFDTPKGFSDNQLQTSANPYQAWAYSQYNFSNRFSVYAMGVVSQNQSYFSTYSNSLGTYNSQMFGVGFNYKISSKASIGASFNFVKANSLQNPFSAFNNNLFNY